MASTADCNDSAARRCVSPAAAATRANAASEIQSGSAPARRILSRLRASRDARRRCARRRRCRVDGYILQLLPLPGRSLLDRVGGPKQLRLPVVPPREVFERSR